MKILGSCGLPWVTIVLRLRGKLLPEKPGGCHYHPWSSFHTLVSLYLSDAFQANSLKTSANSELHLPILGRIKCKKNLSKLAQIRLMSDQEIWESPLSLRPNLVAFYSWWQACGINLQWHGSRSYYWQLPRYMQGIPESWHPQSSWSPSDTLGRLLLMPLYSPGGRGGRVTSISWTRKTTYQVGLLRVHWNVWMRPLRDPWLWDVASSFRSTLQM